MNANDLKFALLIAAVVYAGSYVRQHGLSGKGPAEAQAASAGDPGQRLAALCRRAAARIPVAEKLVDNARLWDCWNTAVDANLAATDRAAVLSELQAIETELAAAVGVPDVDKPPAPFSREAAAAVFAKHGTGS